MKMNKVKPDEYYSDGTIEVARLGNIVSMKNNGSIENTHNILENLSEVKEQIESLVTEIKNDVVKSNPLELLLFSNQMVIMATLNKMSEIEYTKDEIAVLRCTEYIQSVLVSCESKYNKDNDIDYQVLYHKIIANITDLYNLLYDFYFVWMGYAKMELKIESQLIDYILEAQMSYLIRGSKYQYNQLTDLEILLKFQNEKLIELFDIDYSSIIEGLKKLEHSLSSGIIDAMDDLDNEFEQFQELENSNKTKEEVAKIMTDKNLDKSEFVGKIFGTDLYDVIKVTGWSSKFVDALTLEMNSCSSFFTGDDYAGWPIRDLPVQKKPFIRINNKVFCFDYYSLFDNCYRVIQKSIKEQSPDYTTEWASKQKEASETLVGNIFKKIFPDANIYTDNYYPKNNSLKHCNENDLIISYEDIVIIVEVKAGSFTYTSPIIDYKSHIESFKNLVEKADNQCERTFDYINKSKLATFYTSKKIPKVTFDVKDVREFYTMSITVDNFNEFEAKAEKISFINIMNGSIVLNIDELRLYSDYFNSPLLFLHYLKERKKAAMLKTLYLNDELDHLGMYIKHNMYTLNFPDSDITKIQAYGYREDLDRYFGSLHIDELSYPKPEQEIPYEIKEIIKFIESSKLEQKSKIVSFLLDFSCEARQEFCDQIKAILVRQRKLGRMLSYCAYGDLKYCVFVHQDGIFSLSEKDKIDYIYSNILLANEKDRMIIELFYDSKNQLIDFKYRLIKYSDIPKDDFERLSEQVEILRKKRVENVKANSKKKKIGRNDPCPCGSGKKYKKCCLNNEIRKQKNLDEMEEPDSNNYLSYCNR